MLMNVMMEIRDQEMVAVMHVEQKEDGHVVEEHLGWKMCALRNAVIGDISIENIAMMVTKLVEMVVAVLALKRQE